MLGLPWPRSLAGRRRGEALEPGHAPVPTAAPAAGPAMRRSLLWWSLCGCLVVAALVGWAVLQWVQSRLQQDAQRDAAQLVEQVHALSSDGKGMGAVVLLGLVDPHIKRLLQGHIDADAPALQALLAAVIAEYRADNVLVLDRQGMTVAYRATDGSTRGLGRDLSVRPYFKRALVGHPNLYPAVGKNTGERGVYLAAPVRASLDPQAEPLGVVVLKIGMERIDEQLGRYPHAALLLSPEGMVFGGNRRQWLLQATEPIGQQELAALAREERYGELFSGTPTPLPLRTDAGGLHLDGEPVLGAVAAVDWPAAGRDWRLWVLHPRAWADTWGLALLAAGTTGAVGLALVLTVWLRQGRRLERIRERREAADAVARELAFQQGLIDALPNPLFIKDAQGRYTTLNRAFEEAFGVRREALIGRTTPEWRGAAEPDGAQAHANDLQVITSGARVRRSVAERWADGQLHQTLFWGQGLRDPQGHASGMVGVLLDVSTEAQAREALRARELLLRALLESAPGAVIVADRGGRVLFHNQHALELFRVDVQAMTEQAMERRYADPRQRAQLHAILHRDGLVHAMPLEMLRGDGSRFWAEVSLSRGSFAEHADVAFGWCVDITERRREALAMQAAKDAAEAATAAKSSFLANMSHELRTPMNAIIGLAHLALQTPLNAQQREYLLKMHSAARVLAGIVDDVLDFSRIDAGKVVLQEAAFDLDALWLRLAEMFGARAADKGLELVFAVDVDAPHQLSGDVARLEQVLVKLLDNAVKFTDRGEVVLQCSYRANAEGTDGTGALELAVQDSGVGLRQEQLAQLFQPFQQIDGSSTRRFGGLGLGLSLCKRLVDAAGGDIGAQVRPQGGSRFTVRWPCRVRDGVGRGAGGHAAPGGARRALVVERHALAGQTLVGILHSLGVVADCTADADAVPAWLARQSEPVCLLVSASFAGTPSLPRWLAQARASSSPPLVLVTERLDDAARAAAVQWGAVGVLGKPATRAGLLGAWAARAPLVLPHGPAHPPSAGLGGVRLLLVQEEVGDASAVAAHLRDAGAQVQTVGDLLSCAEHLRQHPPVPWDLVLLDLPRQGASGTGPALLADVDWGGVPIVALVDGASSTEQLHWQAAGVHALVDKPVDMAQLIASVLRWVDRRIPEEPGATTPAAPAAPVSDGVDEAQAAQGLQLLCSMLEALDGEAGAQLESLLPWLRPRVQPSTLQQVLRLVELYDLDEAAALLRAEPGLARWLQTGAERVSLKEEGS
jgi:PAS domain S-box-containing protein